MLQHHLAKQKRIYFGTEDIQGPHPGISCSHIMVYRCISVGVVVMNRGKFGSEISSLKQTQQIDGSTSSSVWNEDQRQVLGLKGNGSVHLTTFGCMQKVISAAQSIVEILTPLLLLFIDGSYGCNSLSRRRHEESCMPCTVNTNKSAPVHRKKSIPKPLLFTCPSFCYFW